MRARRLGRFPETFRLNFGKNAPASSVRPCGLERQALQETPRKVEEELNVMTSLRKQALSEIASQKVAPAVGYDQAPETLFGSNVFGLAAMKAHLPKEVFRSLKRTIEKGESLNPAIADTVASAMREWASSKGATHFAHLFYPL